LPFFHKIGCHGNVYSDIGKRGPDRSSRLFGEKTAKMSPVDPEIIVHQAIITQRKKNKEINASKTYCPVASLPSWLNKGCTYLLPAGYGRQGQVRF